MNRLDEIRAKRTAAYECEHGRVAAKCETCDDAETIADLRDRIDAAVKALESEGIGYLTEMQCLRGECRHGSHQALRILRGGD